MEGRNHFIFPDKLQGFQQTAIEVQQAFEILMKWSTTKLNTWAYYIEIAEWWHVQVCLNSFKKRFDIVLLVGIRRAGSNCYVTFCCRK